MRSALAAAAQKRANRRSRSNSLAAVPPAETSNDYSPELAAIAASILYRCPQPSPSGRPIYILNAAAFPDAFEVDYDSLLSYVLARLPGEDELLSGTEYEIIFFAGGQPEGATSEKKQGPGMGWYLQTYHLLSRATRKKLERLYIVHPRTWVRVLIGVFGTIVSPKFRRKIIHVNTLSQLALHVEMEKLLIPPAVYLHDRKISSEVEVPYVTGRRAFGARHPLPRSMNNNETRLPRVLRETTSFVLLPANVSTEGLFRIPPHSVLSGVLREAYDRGQQYIVWKEKGATFVQPGIEQDLIDEVRTADAYGIHSACSLIKTWYRELLHPIFPESSYSTLRSKYGNPDTPITPEDLVDIVLPISPASPLRGTSREMLTRHLLPMLSAVAKHEPQNRMNAENLAICFSMALVCGSDQLEDAKMSSVIKRILEAAIDMWPQLRNGLGIDAHAFERDLQPPKDSRDYEDPLEEEPYKRLSEDDAIEGHRIILADAEDKLTVERAPKLPPRPGAVPAAEAPPNLDTTATTIKRKPAPYTPFETAAAIGNPPRYSSVFDRDGNSLYRGHSPIEPVDGFGPPRRSNLSYSENEKKGFHEPEPAPIKPPKPSIAIPKRKAVSGDSSSNNTSPISRTCSEGGTGAAKIARLAAQKAANNMTQKLTSAPTIASPTAVEPDAGTVLPMKLAPAFDPAATEEVFRNPSWPASATRQQSLAKPMYAHIVPIIRHPSPQPATNTNNDVRRHRAPSPGLLKRMQSMPGADVPTLGSDGGDDRGRTLQEPKRLDLKRNSVEDLRRLYEERVTTAESLRAAEIARRGSR